MAYGLQIFNTAGQLMFDTTRDMDSYVVKSAGTASSVQVRLGEILFVRVPPADQTASNDLSFFAEPQGYPGSVNTSANPQTFEFNRCNPEFSGATITSVNLDYFIIAPSKDVSVGTDTHGLQVLNEDGTVQFDSRTLGSNHFQTVDSFSYPDVGGNGNYTTVANGSQYISVTDFQTNPVQVNVWTYFDRSGAGGPLNSYQIAAFRYQASPIQVRAGESDIERSEEENEEIVLIQFFPRIESQILIGTLS
jgi:hypothetical protein